MTLDMSTDELLSTTRSVRLRLDFDTPVPRAVLSECLTLALQAPNASGAQGWRWVFVDDPEKKRALAEIYRANLAGVGRKSAVREPSDQSTQRARMAASGAHLAAHLQDAPFILIPCLQGRVDRSPSAMSATFWASVMPAAWSFCLALRSRGLGTCWTTLHLFGNGERAVAELLNIPYDEYSQVGMFPIAYTKGVDFKPARRLGPEDVTHWNCWSPEA
ncbi:oxidoreductase [Mycobacterium antarcticum]|uniref:nitroreductase family protein n=1 Tax=unclassified Mycolicibacterium TaxID=2636767 RepID=UPI00239ADC21|nr:MULTISPECIES: nitroreductase family protein [unclassified Mycolicibacterium]BDX35249.1 oxidoreductase [Mycolicibacterium sp. TUM20985]GLP81510.1 oxidoreductase [Mycolicibacterium sp. TUM20984]